MIVARPQNMYAIDDLPCLIIRSVSTSNGSTVVNMAESI